MKKKIIITVMLLAITTSIVLCCLIKVSNQISVIRLADCIIMIEVMNKEIYYYLYYF